MMAGMKAARPAVNRQAFLHPSLAIAQVFITLLSDAGARYRMPVKYQYAALTWSPSLRCRYACTHEPSGTSSYARIRVLASNRPWHPTTIRRGQASDRLADLSRAPDGEVRSGQHKAPYAPAFSKLLKTSRPNSIAIFLINRAYSRSVTSGWIPHWSTIGTLGKRISPPLQPSRSPFSNQWP